MLAELVAASVRNTRAIGEHAVFGRAPHDARDLLRLALQVNPRHRISAEAFCCRLYELGSTAQLMELAGGAARVAATLQENQSLQLGEDALVPAHTYERSIAEACTCVQQKSLTPPHCELRPPVNLLRCTRHRCIIACSCWGPRHSSSRNAIGRQGGGGGG